MNHEKHERHEKIIYRNESYKIQGAIFEVYKIIGPGFLEAVYQECLEKEFALRNIPFRSQVEISFSRSQSPDWECNAIETLSGVSKVGFGNEIMVVGLGNRDKFSKMIFKKILYFKTIFVLFVLFVVKILI